jgi:hypothetical protein
LGADRAENGALAPPRVAPLQGWPDREGLELLTQADEDVKKLTNPVIQIPQ